MGQSACQLAEFQGGGPSNSGDERRQTRDVRICEHSSIAETLDLRWEWFSQHMTCEFIFLSFHVSFLFLLPNPYLHSYRNRTTMLQSSRHIRERYKDRSAMLSYCPSPPTHFSHFSLDNRRNEWVSSWSAVGIAVSSELDMH